MKYTLFLLTLLVMFSCVPDSVEPQEVTVVGSWIPASEVHNVGEILHFHEDGRLTRTPDLENIKPTWKRVGDSLITEYTLNNNLYRSFEIIERLTADTMFFPDVITINPRGRELTNKNYMVRHR